MARSETLGDRIRRMRQEQGLSLAGVSGGDFSRAFLNQVELGRSQPSTRVLRVIAGRLGTRVDYLLDGGRPVLERELALEKGRVLLARGEPRRALLALRSVASLPDWPLGTDARLAQAAALMATGREPEARELIAREKAVIAERADRHRLSVARAIEKGRRLDMGPDPIGAHLRLADHAQRAGDGQDALEHYRAARVLLEAGGSARDPKRK